MSNIVINTKLLLDILLIDTQTSSSLLKQIFKVFVPILLNVNLSLNQTLLTFLLYVGETWMTQWILAICL